MQQKHLTYGDLEQYLDTTDVSEEYLCRIESVMQHLDECEHCQKLLQRMLLISSVCDEDNIAGGLAVLKEESVIRRELFALRIEMAEQDERMQELAARFRAGMLKQMVVYHPRAIRASMVARGDGEAMRQSPIRIQFDAGKVKVFVYCEEGKEVTVILESNQEKEGLIIKQAKASTEGLVVLEFDKAENDDKYSFYIDIQ
ncbi:MAG: hypothetical protein IJ379_12060 [Lachnospiraceae bacterium]|nr:hypothetical protein [Lachnospiraceae bacterium]